MAGHALLSAGIEDLLGVSTHTSRSGGIGGSIERASDAGSLGGVGDSIAGAGPANADYPGKPRLALARIADQLLIQAAGVKALTPQVDESGLALAAVGRGVEDLVGEGAEGLARSASSILGPNEPIHALTRIVHQLLILSTIWNLDALLVLVESVPVYALTRIVD